MQKINEELFGFGRSMNIYNIELKNIKKESDIDILMKKIKNNRFELIQNKDAFKNNIKYDTDNTDLYFMLTLENMYDILYDLYKIVKYIYNNDENDTLKNKYNDNINDMFIFISKNYTGVIIIKNKYNTNQMKHYNLMVICTYFLNRINRLYYNRDHENFYIKENLVPNKEKTYKCEYFSKVIEKSNNYNI